MNSLNSSVSEEILVGVPNISASWYSAVKDRLVRAPWWQQTLAFALATLVYVYAAGWLGATALPRLQEWGEGVPPIHDIAPGSVPWLFVRWDSGYYWQVATSGYRPDGDERAFYPLYPMVIRAVSLVLPVSTLWSGLFVSVMSFLGAGILTFKWIRIDYGHTRAIWTAVLMYVYPMAFYLVAFYAEPLFLLFAVLSLYLSRRGWFAASGMAIALAGATRPQALLLGIPYVLEFWQQHNFARKQWLQFLIGISVAPVGMLAYLSFLAQLSNSSNVYETYTNLQYRVWGNYSTWPWTTLGDALGAVIFGIKIQPDWFSRVFTLDDLFFALLSLSLSLLAFRTMRFSQAAYLFIGILFFYSKHGPFGYGFHSIPRHLGSLPPLYLAMALFLDRLPTRLRWAIVVMHVLLLGLFSAWFASGRWVS